eukprot:m.942511 g.942511  ORF g.942511 m.942511 type:complete len:73 (-) comp263956_c0_seq1:23-241(-)
MRMRSRRRCEDSMMTCPHAASLTTSSVSSFTAKVCSICAAPCFFTRSDCMLADDKVWESHSADPHCPTLPRW